MYETLVERLKIAADWAGKGFCITQSLCLEAADAIEKLSVSAHNGEAAYSIMVSLTDYVEELKQKIPRWIPVTERPPEKDDPVFVYLFSDSPYIAWINHEGEWETEEFTIDRDCLPKAWMPLPEPPKEET